MSSAAAVIELLSDNRAIELVRTFEHGASGTSLARLDGEPVVVKAWSTTSAREQTLTAGLHNAKIMTDRSVPVPILLERGTVGAYSYLLYEFVEGEWPPRVNTSLASQMLNLVDLQRNAAPGADPQWPTKVARLITHGDAALDIRPERLQGSPIGQHLLRNAQASLESCDPSHLRSADIVHGDFAPENLLVRDGQITAVLDWEQSRAGDVGFDLAGMIYDIELGQKADPNVLAGLYQVIKSDVPSDAWQLYTDIYAIRYASWAVNTDMEADVISAISRITAARYHPGR